jgi:membrane protease YdiL (CAAX protease family)
MDSLKFQFNSFSTFIKLLFLIILSVLGAFVVSVLGVIMGFPFYGNDIISVFMGKFDLNNSIHISLLKYLQTLTHLGIFIAPAYIYSVWFEDGFGNFYLFKRPKLWLVVLIGCFTMILMVPFVNFLGDINLQLTLPERLKSIEQLMRNSEDRVELIVNKFMSQKSWIAFMVNILMIAIVPAIGEELIFRGIVMRNFNKWFKNIHVAIFISAFIFSAFHMQFYSFLPRFFLGIVLGYMFVWSGSLVLPILAHFVNNAGAVIVSFLYANGLIKQDMNSFGNFRGEPILIFLLSLLGFMSLLILYYVNRKTNIFFKKI